MERPRSVQATLRRVPPQTRSCWPDICMSGLTVVISFLLATASSHAQISPKELTLAGVSDCLREAISTSSVEENGSVVIFYCSAAKAKTLYGFLGRKVRAETVQDSNGKFENRQFGNSACYHRIEDPNGKATDDFRCDLILMLGDALSD